MFVTRIATSSDADWMQSSFDNQMGWQKPAGYFARCCQQQDAGEIILLVAVSGDDFVGHTKIVRKPPYPGFRERGIPEIQDLNVLPAYRRQGAATVLMDHAERLIGHWSNLAGIGVGLYPDYGPAQRMYVLRGYVPDGAGVAYRDVTVAPGTTVTVDDDLVLRLIKRL